MILLYRENGQRQKADTHHRLSTLMKQTTTERWQPGVNGEQNLRVKFYRERKYTNNT